MKWQLAHCASTNLHFVEVETRSRRRWRVARRWRTEVAALPQTLARRVVDSGRPRPKQFGHFAVEQRVVVVVRVNIELTQPLPRIQFHLTTTAPGCHTDRHTPTYTTVPPHHRGTTRIYVYTNIYSYTLYQSFVQQLLLYNSQTLKEQHQRKLKVYKVSVLRKT